LFFNVSGYRLAESPAARGLRVADHGKVAENRRESKGATLTAPKWHA
jgi:hypothetical protein